MSQSMKEKLAGLNRQYRDLEIKSSSGEDSLTVLYRRPTELEDEILRKAMEDEFESLKNGLKKAENGKESIFEQMRRTFNEGKIDDAIGYIVLERINPLREASILEAGLKELPEDASEDDKKKWLADFKPVFDRRIQEAKDEWKDVPQEVLATRAAESRLESIARERAYSIYRRCVVAQSLYSKNEETEEYEHIFTSPEEVSELLDKDTIDTLAAKIVEEINRYKNVPLK